MQAIVPEGKKPGDDFQVALGPSQVTLEVPKDMSEGREIEFQVPGGATMKAVVPAGLRAGDTFTVSLLPRDHVPLSELCAAAGAGDLGAVKKRVEAGLSVNAVFDMGFTPIFYAATNGQLEVAQWLLEQRADVTVQNHDKRTPLHWGARNGHVEVVKLLLAAKAPLDLQDLSGRTPVTLAEDKGQTEIARLLRQAAA
mmetsp:Transcript_75070/g.212149  ORF Transcript_75070/g.212149 Transcript_75070/m.212149 type:complete len:197 (+) Transcript_75070:362-952(+)